MGPLVLSSPSFRVVKCESLTSVHSTNRVHRFDDRIFDPNERLACGRVVPAHRGYPNDRNQRAHGSDRRRRRFMSAPSTKCEGNRIKLTKKDSGEGPIGDTTITSTAASSPASKATRCGSPPPGAVARDVRRGEKLTGRRSRPRFGGPRLRELWVIPRVGWTACVVHTLYAPRDGISGGPGGDSLAKATAV